MAPSALTLSAAAAAAVRSAWFAADGREPCGYLLGRARMDGTLEILEALAGRNAHPAPRAAFRLTPEEQLAARRRAGEQNMRVVGFWHGHLAGPPAPSRSDFAGVGEHAPGLMLIVGRAAAARPALEAWRRVDGAWRPWRIAVSEQA